LDIGYPKNDAEQAQRTASVERDTEIRGWFDSLLVLWQRAWDLAEPRVRAGVEASLCHLEQPIQGALNVSRRAIPS